MQVIADLHLHSRFSRAVSNQMTIPVLDEWATKKGIDLVGTGDFTHPVWLRELETNLEEVNPGIFRYKKAQGQACFLLSTEISSIYSQGGKTRRIHDLVLAPSFATIGKINQTLASRGCNLVSDGRPIIGLSAKQLLELVLGIDERCLFIPAHIWTPWFSLFGSISGFDSLEECFGELSKHIYAIETGQSSDPAMNWRISELLSRQIVSFGDAHSPRKIGREATVFDLEELSFENISRAVKGGNSKNKITYTIEFYPEEGRYHFTGHRKCQVVYSPKEARKKGLVCPVCGRKLTVGVMSQVEKLASEDPEVRIKKDKLGVSWIQDQSGKRPPYVMLVPLQEIIAESLSLGVSTKTVQGTYEQMINSLGTEFEILLKFPLEKMQQYVEAKTIEGIKKVRGGDIVIEPGYDGIYGTVKIWSAANQTLEEKDNIDQGVLF